MTKIQDHYTVIQIFTFYYHNSDPPVFFLCPSDQEDHNTVNDIAFNISSTMHLIFPYNPCLQPFCLTSPQQGHHQAHHTKVQSLIQKDYIPIKLSSMAV